MKIPGLFLLFYTLLTFSEVIAQCPDITSSGSDPALPSTFCGGENITFSAEGENLPMGGTVDWYMGNNNSFDAYNGEGTFVGSSNISSVGCMQDPEVLYIMINPDNTQVGTPTNPVAGDRCDEFIVLWTGSGGFTPNDISISGLGTGTDVWDSFEPGNPSTFNCPVIPLNATDPIPENAILIIQSNPVNNVVIDATELCSSGLPVFVIAYDGTPSCDFGYISNSSPCIDCYPISINSAACTYNLALAYNIVGGSMNGWGHSNLLGSGIYADVIPQVSIPIHIPGNQAIDDFTWTIPADFCQNNPGGTYFINGIINPAPTSPCTEVFTDYFEFQVNCPTASISGGGNLCVDDCPGNPGQVQINFSGGVAPYSVDIIVSIPGFPNLQIPAAMFNAVGIFDICVQGVFPFYDPGTQTIVFPEGLAGQSATFSISNVRDANNCPVNISLGSTVQLNVIDSPVADATPTENSCAGSPVTLNGSIIGNGTGMWSSEGDGMFDNVTQGMTNYTPGPGDVLNGSVIVEWIVNDPGMLCAADTAMTNITISNAVEITLVDEIDVCSNDDILLDPFLNNTGFDILWSTSGDGSFFDPVSLSTTYFPGPNDLFLENVVLTITLSDPTGLCPAVVATQTVTFQPKMMVELPDSVFVCADEFAMLSATLSGSVVSVTWMSSGDGEFEDASSPMTLYEPGPVDLLDQFVELLILVSDESPVCDDTIGTVTLVIETCTCPSVELLAPIDPICDTIGSILDLNALEITTEPGSWSITQGPAGPQPIIGPGQILNAENATPGLYELTFHLANPVFGCPDSASVSLIIETCTCPSVELLAPTDPVCDTIGSILDLNTLEITTEPGSWSITQGPGGPQPIIGPGDTLSAENATPGVYELTFHLTNPVVGCPDSASVSLLVESCTCPSVELIEPTGPVCDTMGSILVLNALEITTEPGSWSITQGPGGPQPIIGPGDTLSAENATPGVYELTFHLTNPVVGCPDSASVSLLVESCTCPSVELIEPTGPVCDTMGSILVLNALEITTEPGSWSITQGPGGPQPIIDPGDTLSAENATPGVYELTFHLANPVVGCPDSATVSLVIETCTCPSLEILEPVEPICNAMGSILDLNLLAVTMEAGSWSVTQAPAGQQPTINPGEILIAQNATPGLYELTFHLANPVIGCPDSASVQLEIIGAPQILIIGDDSYCNPGMIDLLANTEGQAEVFQWQSNGTGSFNPADMVSAIYTPTLLDIQNGGFQLSVFTQDSFGICPEGRDTLNVTISQPVFASFSNTTLTTCNETSMGSVVNLSALITGGDMSGPWSVASGQMVDLSIPSAVDFNGVAPGNVTLEYTTNTAVFPCTDSTYQVIVQVQDCSCPPILIGVTPTSICAQESVLALKPFVSGSDPGIWTVSMIEGSGSTPSILLDSVIINSGTHGTFQFMYTLESAPNANCPDSVIFDLFIQEEPKVSLPNDTLICASSELDISASIDGSATGGIWSILNGDGSFQNPNLLNTVFTPGPGSITTGSAEILFTSLDTFGFCPEATGTMNITFADTAFATFQVNQTTICNQFDSGSVVNLIDLITDGDNNGIWLDIDGAGINLNDPTNVDFDGFAPGSYRLRYTTFAAMAPCTNPSYFVEIIVEDCECPSVALTLSDTAVCDQSMGIELNHFVLTEEPGTWLITSNSPMGSQPAFIQAGELIVQNADTGKYVLTFTLNDSVPGCIASNSIIIGLDVPPDLEIIEILCTGDNQSYEVVLTSNGIEPELNFGTLIEESPNTYKVIDIPLDETLVIKFRQTATACKSSAIINPPQCDCLLDFEFYATDVSCYGVDDGQVIIDTLIKPSGDACASIDGGPCLPISMLPFTISNLSPGEHMLVVEDASGCIQEKEVSISEPTQLTVDLGGDRSVTSGDSVLIDPVFNFDPRQWTYNPVLFDSSSIAGYFHPTTDLVLSLTANDADDCNGSDQIFIEVIAAPVDEAVIFIPNIFTPNGDQINDVLFVHAGEGIEQMESFRVFDRWGHLVFEISFFPPNEQVLGWDGTRKGEPMMPGVYVYQLIYQDGQEQIVRRGDVTLIR